MATEKTTAGEKTLVNAAVSINIVFGLFVQLSFDVILGMGMPAPISWGEFLVFGIISLTLWAAIIAFLKLSAARGSLIFLLFFGLFFLNLWSASLLGALGVNPSAESYELHVLNRVIGFATTMLLVLYAFFRLMDNQNNQLASTALIVAIVASIALLVVPPDGVLLGIAGVVLALKARGSSEPGTPNRSTANNALILLILVVVVIVGLILTNVLPAAYVESIKFIPDIASDLAAKR